MPLLEVTTRTLPLQKELKSVVGQKDVRFVTDSFSVEEARAQINLSYNNAHQALKKAKEASERLGLRKPMEIGWVFAKSLAEPIFGGRHETLRWVDSLADADARCKQGQDFPAHMRAAIVI